MAVSLVSQTPADNTLGWDPSQPMTIVLETNTGTMRPESFRVSATGTPGYVIDNNIIAAGWEGTLTLSNGGTRLTVTFRPVGGWQPSANYGAGPGQPVTYLIFFFANDTSEAFINRYDSMQFTTGPGEVVATDPAAVSLCIEPARFASSRS